MMMNWSTEINLLLFFLNLLGLKTVFINYNGGELKKAWHIFF